MLSEKTKKLASKKFGFLSFYLNLTFVTPKSLLSSIVSILRGLFGLRNA